MSFDGACVGFVGYLITTSGSRADAFALVGTVGLGDGATEGVGDGSVDCVGVALGLVVSVVGGAVDGSPVRPGGRFAPG